MAAAAPSVPAARDRFGHGAQPQGRRGSPMFWALVAGAGLSAVAGHLPDAAANGASSFSSASFR